MNRLLIGLTMVLALSACSVTEALKTPQDKYYATTTAVTEVTNAALTYVKTCKALPVDKSKDCRSKFPAIHAATVKVQIAVKELDKVFVTGDSTYYSLDLTLTENAIANLKKVLN